MRISDWSSDVCSSDLQTNLDFESEADMVEKYRISLALQPPATALFASSPFVEGRPSGFVSFRGNVWTDSDPDRFALLPFVLNAGFRFELYINPLLHVPTYARERYVEGKMLHMRF